MEQTAFLEESLNTIAIGGNGYIINEKNERTGSTVLNDNIEESQQTENSEDNIDEDELLDNRLRTLTSDVTNIISDYFTNENPGVYNFTNAFEGNNAPQVSVEIHTQMTDGDSDSDSHSDSDSYSDIQPNYSVD